LGKGKKDGSGRTGKTSLNSMDSRRPMSTEGYSAVKIGQEGGVWGEKKRIEPLLDGIECIVLGPIPRAGIRLKGGDGVRKGKIICRVCAVGGKKDLNSWKKSAPILPRQERSGKEVRPEGKRETNFRAIRASVKKADCTRDAISWRGKGISKLSCRKRIFGGNGGGGGGGVGGGGVGEGRGGGEGR